MNLISEGIQVKRKKASRVHTLDWLRGLMALAIMFYHVFGWEFYDLESDNFLGRLGIYAVSIFFILSGLSMAIVYHSFIDSFKKAIAFFVRRIFRIWPLLWIVTIYLFSVIIITGKVYLYKYEYLFLNLTTLFGFIKPQAYMATGAWSIGNEMVYYALTPIIFLLYNHKKIVGNAFLLLCVLVGVYFAFFLLNGDVILADQWKMYINPFNNLFLYVSGIAIYYNFKDVDFNSKLINTVLVICCILFCLLPFSGDQIYIVTGIGRVVFVLLSLIIVFCVYKLQIHLPSFVSKPLEVLGLATYGVYLLHPVLYFIFRDYLKIETGLIVLVPIVTIISSILLYYYFELKLINIGKRVTS